MTEHVVQSLAEMLGLDEHHVDPAIIRDLLTEQYTKARDSHLAKFDGEVWLGLDSATPALTTGIENGKPVIHYHREYCPILLRSDIHRFSVPLGMANKIGFVACTHCTEMTVTQWANRCGVDPDLVTTVMRDDVTKLHKTDALTLLRAIGEPAHPNLRVWERRQAQAA